MDEKIKTWLLRLPAKENPNMEKALFDWPIVLQYDVKAKYRLISRKFSGMKFFHPSVRLTNQRPRAFEIRSINQSNRSISVCLFFLFCSRVFIWRSHENRSKINIKTRNRTSLYTPVCPPEHKFFPADSYFRLPAAFLILVDLWSLPKRNHLPNLSWCTKSTYTIKNWGRFYRTMVFLPGQTMLIDWSSK